MDGERGIYWVRRENFGQPFSQTIWMLNLLSYNASDSTLRKLKVISILYLTLTHLAETRRSRSAAARGGCWLRHTRGRTGGGSFLFGGGKKGRKGTCAMLIRESHMVEARGGRGWWRGGVDETVEGWIGKGGSRVLSTLPGSVEHFQNLFAAVRKSRNELTTAVGVNLLGTSIKATLI